MNLNFLNNLKTNLMNLDDDFYEDYEEEEEVSTASDIPLNKCTNTYLKKFFAKVNTTSNRNDEEILKLFKLAYEESPIKTVKLLFYIRDKKDGLGQRRIFRVILNYLGTINDSIIKGNLNYIPEYGRWDDFYALFGTSLEGYVIDILKKQLDKDLESSSPSYLAKWLKSENTSSKTSKKLATATRKLLGLSSKEYRKTLSILRNKLNIVEKQISRGEWSTIKYGDIPICAMKKYYKAFYKNDKERFKEYKRFNKVSSYKENPNIPNNIIEKITPYKLVENMLLDKESYDDSTYEELWEQQLSYLESDFSNTISIIGLSNNTLNDVQANVALYGGVGIALYLMERNSGRFKNYLISSSPNINLKRIKSNLLRNRIYEVWNSSISEEINIESALDVILYAAIKHNINKEDMPKKLLCITDKKCSISILSRRENASDSILINAEEYENIKYKWETSGYDMPKIVLWTIDSKIDDSTIVMDNKDIIFAFGYSKTIFKAVLSGKIEENTDILDNIINSPRYNRIKDYWF